MIYVHSFLKGEEQKNLMSKTKRVAQKYRLPIKGPRRFKIRLGTRNISDNIFCDNLLVSGMELFSPSPFKMCLTVSQEVIFDLATCLIATSFPSASLKPVYTVPNPPLPEISYVF